MAITAILAGLASTLTSVPTVAGAVVTSMFMPDMVKGSVEGAKYLSGSFNRDKKKRHEDYIKARVELSVATDSEKQEFSALVEREAGRKQALEWKLSQNLLTLSEFTELCDLMVKSGQLSAENRENAIARFKEKGGME